MAACEEPARPDDMIGARVQLPCRDHQILSGHPCPACFSGHNLIGPPLSAQLRRCHNDVHLTTWLPQRRSCRHPSSALAGGAPSDCGAGGTSVTEVHFWDRGAERTTKPSGTGPEPGESLGS